MIKRALLAFMVMITLCLAPLARAAGDTVVYHFDNAATQGLKGLRNIRNHLDTDPTAQIVAVAHAEGVDMMMEGARAATNDTEYAPLISALKARGVRFEVCEITLKNRGLRKEQFVMDAAAGVFDAVAVVSEPFSIAYGMNRLTDALVIDIGAGTVDIFGGSYASLLPGVEMTEQRLTWEISDHRPLWAEAVVRR